MALWMEPGSKPMTEREIADLEAIAAVKQSAALEYKEQGNQFVKKGKKHYSEAIDCYTKAINQKSLSDSENSVIYANRAHVNLLLGNYRRALTDAEEAIKLCQENVKAFYRAAKASLSLGMLTEAKSLSEIGLKLDPNNEGLKKLATQIELQKSEREQRELQVSKAVAVAKDLVAAIESRELKIGKAMFQELTGLKKPSLDKNNILHWPVLLLYAEVMSSDFIEDFCETDMFSSHLDMMFTESSEQLSWDTEKNYTRDTIELYYEADPGICFPKTKLLQYLLQGTAASQLEGIFDEEKESYRNVSTPSKTTWVRVNEKRTLHDVLKEPNFIIPGIPVLYVVSKKSSCFYKKFRAGQWAAPF